MGADHVRDIGRRQVGIVLFGHAVSAWPSCSAITPIGTPRMASVEPCVWRNTWKDTAGLILACLQASAISRTHQYSPGDRGK